MEKSPGKYLKLTAYIILYLSIYFIITNFVALVDGIIEAMIMVVKNNGEISPDKITEKVMGNSAVFTIISASLSLPVYILIFRLRKKKLFPSLNFRNPGVLCLISAVLVGISFNFIINLLIGITGIDSLSPEYERLINNIFSRTSPLLLILSIGIIAPVFEEILFRGIVFRELASKINVVVAIVVQAFLFGAFHMNLTQGIYAFVVGLLLGWSYYVSGSLFVPVLIHLFFNTTSVFLSLLISESTPEITQLILFGVSIPVFLVFFWVIALNKKSIQS